MALILAIEPDSRQAAKVAAVVRKRFQAELVLEASAEQALPQLDGRVPDLILTTALLSPKDDAALVDWLRQLTTSAAYVQTLTIPMLGSPSQRKTRVGGVFSALRRRSAESNAEGCDPGVFADQIAEYLKRAAKEREELEELLEFNRASERVAQQEAPVEAGDGEPVNEFAEFFVTPSDEVGESAAVPEETFRSVFAAPGHSSAAIPPLEPSTIPALETFQPEEPPATTLSVVETNEPVRPATDLDLPLVAESVLTTAPELALETVAPEPIDVVPPMAAESTEPVHLSDPFVPPVPLVEPLAPTTPPDESVAALESVDNQAGVVEPVPLVKPVEAIQEACEPVEPVETFEPSPPHKPADVWMPLRSGLLGLWPRLEGGMAVTPSAPGPEVADTPVQELPEPVEVVAHFEPAEPLEPLEPIELVALADPLESVEAVDSPESAPPVVTARPPVPEPRQPRTSRTPEWMGILEGLRHDVETMRASERSRAPLEPLPPIVVPRPAPLVRQRVVPRPSPVIRPASPRPVTPVPLPRPAGTVLSAPAPRPAPGPVPTQGAAPTPTPLPPPQSGPEPTTAPADEVVPRRQRQRTKPKKAPKKNRPKGPAQDEWGLFDPAQCGFAALLAKLKEATEAEEAEAPDDPLVR